MGITRVIPHIQTIRCVQGVRVRTARQSYNLITRKKGYTEEKHVYTTLPNFHFKFGPFVQY